MKLVQINPKGYCKGVVRAINIAVNTAKSHPNENIYILGMIVHNTYVTEALNQYNITTLYDTNKSKFELLDEINNGIVIFTAHGIDDKVVNYAKNKGLQTINASCQDVLQTRNNIINYLNQGYEVLYIGKKNHPEAEAIMSISKKIHLISSLNDIALTQLNNSKIYVTNQTTMSILEVKIYFDKIQEKYPQALIEDEICNATSMRQMAILNTKDLDLLYVVGDIKSNNSNKLKEIALNHGIKNVRLIASCQEIQESDLNCETVAVTSGASTPSYLTNQVISTLKNYISTKKLVIPSIDITKIL